MLRQKFLPADRFWSAKARMALFHLPARFANRLKLFRDGSAEIAKLRLHGQGLWAAASSGRRREDHRATGPSPPSAVNRASSMAPADALPDIRLGDCRNIKGPPTNADGPFFVTVPSGENDCQRFGLGPLRMRLTTNPKRFRTRRQLVGGARVEAALGLSHIGTPACHRLSPGQSIGEQAAMDDSTQHLRMLCDQWLAAADKARSKEEQIRYLEAALRFAQAAFCLSQGQAPAAAGRAAGDKSRTIESERQSELPRRLPGA